MNMNLRRGVFIFVVVLQLGALAYMIAERVKLLREGQAVLLKCAPVDPRSLLSGDYVILNYEISTFTADRMRELNFKQLDFTAGEDVYLAVTKGADGFARPVALAKDRESLAGRGIVLRGRAREDYYGNEHTPGESVVFSLRYGVEEYFVPQFEGRKIERELGAETHVEVAVGPDGTSALRKLFIKGEEVTFY